MELSRNQESSLFVYFFPHSIFQKGVDKKHSFGNLLSVMSKREVTPCQPLWQLFVFSNLWNQCLPRDLFDRLTLLWLFLFVCLNNRCSDAAQSYFIMTIKKIWKRVKLRWNIFLHVSVTKTNNIVLLLTPCPTCHLCHLCSISMHGRKCVCAIGLCVFVCEYVWLWNCLLLHAWLTKVSVWVAALCLQDGEQRVWESVWLFEPQGSNDAGSGKWKT